MRAFSRGIADAGLCAASGAAEERATRRSIAFAAAVTALLVSAAPALAHPGKPVKGSASPNGQAYGYRCKGQSTRHVKGAQGTAFSRCVGELARQNEHAN
jgi:hypothetical protein